MSKDLTEDNLSWVRKAKEHIAHGSNTNSKRPETQVLGIAPGAISRALQCYLYDPSGNRYIDYISALGTNFVGYGHPKVGHSVFLQMRSGVSYSLNATEEIKFAERIKSFIPFAEKVRFVKTGTEGCMASLKMARAATGRDIILKDGYHGWSTDCLNLPTLNDLDQINDKIAAVILEPIITDASVDRISWLSKLREKTKKTGTCLIFDETITGLRFLRKLVSNHTGIHPDLVIFGKALANGLPLSVIAGRKSVMDSDYFVSGSFSGDLVSIAAANAVLDLLETEFPIDKSILQSTYFTEQFNNTMKDLVRIEGYGMRGIIKAKDDLTYDLFLQETAKAGILFGKSFFWNPYHAQETDNVINILKSIRLKLESTDIKLEGPHCELPVTHKIRE